RRLPLLERFRVVDELRGRLDRRGAGTRFDHAVEDLLFRLNRALDRVHQVRHQIGAALILIEHLGPGRSHLLVLLLQPVVAATGQERAEESQQTNAQKMHDGALRNSHESSPGSSLWSNLGSSLSPAPDSALETRQPNRPGGVRVPPTAAVKLRKIV